MLQRFSNHYIFPGFLHQKESGLWIPVSREFGPGSAEPVCLRIARSLLL